MEEDTREWTIVRRRRRKERRNFVGREPSPPTAGQEDAAVGILDDEKEGGEVETRIEDSSPSTAVAESAPGPTLDDELNGKETAGTIAAENVPAAGFECPSTGGEEDTRTEDSSSSTAALENALPPTFDSLRMGDYDDEEEETRTKHSSPYMTAAEDTPSPTAIDVPSNVEEDATRGIEPSAPIVASEEPPAAIPTTPVKSKMGRGKRGKRKKSKKKHGCSEPPSPTAIPENAPDVGSPVDVKKAGEDEKSRATTSSPSPTAIPENAPDVGIPVDVKKAGEDEKSRATTSSPSPSPSPSILAETNGPSPITDILKNVEEGARIMEPSASSLAAEEAPTSVDRAIVKPNKGKEKIEEPSHELESFPLTAAPEMYSPWTAAYGGLITIANPLHIRVGTLVHLVVVTNNADEASEWVRSLSPEFPNRNRIIGLSSYRTVYSRHDGYIYRHVVSLHLSCASRVLIYYMDPPVTTFYSRDVLDLLHHPSNIFVGCSVDETLYLLGAPYRIGAPEAIELDRVAEILGVENLMSISRATGLQPHIVLAYNFLHLPIEDLRSTRTPERIIEWPPTQVHVDFAVETAVISQMLGNRARLRLRAQAQPPEEN